MRHRRIAVALVAALLPDTPLLPQAPPHGVPRRLETGDRILEWVMTPRVRLDDLDSVVAEARSWLPLAFSAAPIAVNLSPPQVAGGQVVVHGRYTINGLEEPEAEFRLVFAGGGELIFADRPRLAADAPLDLPPAATVTRRHAEVLAARVARERFPDAALHVEVSGLRYRLKTRRSYYHATIAGRWDDPAAGSGGGPQPGETHFIQIDAHSGEVFESGRFALHAPTTGVCRGLSLGMAGPAVRHAQGHHNPHHERPVAGVPLELRQSETGDVASTRTGADGSFEIVLPEKQPWRLEALWSDWDFALLFQPDAQRLEGVLEGTGDLALALQVTSQGLDELALESRAGSIFTWEMLHRLRAWGEEVRLRASILWDEDSIEKDSLGRGLPGHRCLQVHRHRPRPGIVPFGGAYTDATWPAAFHFSEANDRFHDWSTASVVAHEWGHSLFLSFTGQDTRGSPPEGHSLIFHESLADICAWLFQEEVDLDGKLQGIIGFGQKRGLEDGGDFRRDIRLGRACDPTPEPAAPCGLREGLGLHGGSGTTHDLSLAASGFFYDLAQLLKARYGAREGHVRVTDLVFRFLAYHCHGLVTDFTLEKIAVLLLVNDDSYFGGDNAWTDGGPDWDLIRQAALARNLWPLRFLRGDADSSGQVDLSDAVSILVHLFLGGGRPGCLDAADADDSGVIDVTDAVAVLRHLFLGAGDLAHPRDCSHGKDTERIDPTPLDRLTCLEPSPTCSN